MTDPEIAATSNDSSIDEIVKAIRAGADWREILNRCVKWLHNRSRILFREHRDLFVGLTEDDVLDEIQSRFMNRLKDHGFEGCRDNAHVAGRLRTFMKWSAQETKTAQIRKQKNDAEWRDMMRANDEAMSDSKETPVESPMRVVFLRTCIEELRSDKQRELAQAMLTMGLQKGEVAKAWRTSLQAVQNISRRMLDNLRLCIETKMKEM